MNLIETLFLCNGLLTLGSSLFFAYAFRANRRSFFRIIPASRESKKNTDALTITFITTACSAQTRFFIETLEHYLNLECSTTHPGYRIEIREGKRSTELTAHLVRSALTDTSRLVIVDGLFTTQIAEDIARKTGSSKPVIFTDVSPDEEALIFESRSKPATFIRASYQRDIYTELKTLLLVNKTYKRTIILHGTPPSEREVHAIAEAERFCVDHGLSSLRFSLPGTTSEQKLAPEVLTHIQKSDLVLMFHHTLSSDLRKQLGTICNAHQVALVFSESDTPETQRAAISFESTPADRMHALARTIGGYLNHYPASQSAYTMKVSPALFAQQHKKSLDKTILFLMKHTIIEHS